MNKMASFEDIMISNINDRASRLDVDVALDDIMEHFGWETTKRFYYELNRRTYKNRDDVLFKKMIIEKWKEIPGIDEDITDGD
jgi:hypothetical protein